MREHRFSHSSRHAVPMGAASYQEKSAQHKTWCSVGVQITHIRHQYSPIHTTQIASLVTIHPPLFRPVLYKPQHRAKGGDIRNLCQDGIRYTTPVERAYSGIVRPTQYVVALDVQLIRYDGKIVQSGVEQINGNVAILRWCEGCEV